MAKKKQELIPRVWTDEKRNAATNGFKNLIPYPKKEKYRSENARKVNANRYPDSHLYILHILNTSHYKIGVSNKPKRRIQDIRSSMPYAVSVIYCQKHKNTYNLEEMIHENFPKKAMNHEWFNLTKDDVQSIINTLKDFTTEGIYLIRRKQQNELSL